MPIKQTAGRDRLGGILRSFSPLSSGNRFGKV